MIAGYPAESGTGYSSVLVPNMHDRARKQYCFPPCLVEYKSQEDVSCETGTYN